eukprot:CAMPEP_0203941304 /NCGR_PEP_ID=MMETSP0359-20131031/77709_1 /ASSEMBLY_ACC=CAM_ASM_000338 /TAXON_ID=268821 /ORGANISM="Scrippsiella Hangoei, Strain SHTV-5" /LENGTH=83 /DNA_ID=CAMNT_0050871847 /DNA_START=48 /DNA_END=296 /DNA_ORIENTATION=-
MAWGDEPTAGAQGAAGAGAEAPVAKRRRTDAPPTAALGWESFLAVRRRAAEGSVVARPQEASVRGTTVAAVRTAIEFVLADDR